MFILSSNLSFASPHTFECLSTTVCYHEQSCRLPRDPQLMSTCYDPLNIYIYVTRYYVEFSNEKCKAVTTVRTTCWLRTLMLASLKTVLLEYADERVPLMYARRKYGGHFLTHHTRAVLVLCPLYWACRSDRIM